MVIGDGLLANIFQTYKNNNDVVIFASGVSNSNEKQNSEFFREKAMIKDIVNKYSNILFVYFSSCSLEDQEMMNTPYHMHKKDIEEFIKSRFTKYLIFRLPNIIGYLGNKNTIINFLIDKITNNEEFTVWSNATRNIVDVEDLNKIVSSIINKNRYTNKTINISYDKNINILELIDAIENMLNIKAIYITENKGVDMKINNSLIQETMRELSIEQPDILTLINKYKAV